MFASLNNRSTYYLGAAAAVIGLLASLALPFGASAQRPPTNTIVPVEGEVTTLTQGVFDVAGTLEITSVDVVGGQPVVNGVFDGTLTRQATGAVTNVVDEPVQLPIAAQGPGQSCQILFLDLGPLFLDLLGLQVSLSEVILDITAVPGPGNLLGNLLCALAGLLDPQGQNPLNQGLLDRLLSRINDLL
jgi:hypothetical protein